MFAESVTNILNKSLSIFLNVLFFQHTFLSLINNFNIYLTFEMLSFLMILFWIKTDPANNEKTTFLAFYFLRRTRSLIKLIFCFIWKLSGSADPSFGFSEPIIKSPPEPTRVKSPEQVCHDIIHWKVTCMVVKYASSSKLSVVKRYPTIYVYIKVILRSPDPVNWTG